MSKSTLTWYKTKTKRIMRDINALKKKDIADELCMCHQTASYRVTHVYPKLLEEFVLVLDLAGYEIREKGES